MDIALQLYTVRSLTARNMLPTLRRLAAIGYGAVELSGYGDSHPREIRALADDLGLTVVGAHIPFESLVDHPQQIFTDMQILGCRYVVVPWVPESRRSSLEATRRLAAQLNQAGALLNEEGLALIYHNHVYEFSPLDGSTIWQTLVDTTDPALVSFELDLYWARYAGWEPLDLIDQLRGRLPLIHCKDMAADHTRADVPIGAGIMPWRRILEAAETAGTRWAVIEQDHPRNPLENVQTSLQRLRELTGWPAGYPAASG